MKTTLKGLVLAAASLAFAGAAGAAYKCVDEKGLTHIGDTPPDQCANVVMYEVSRSGTVIRKIEPSLTADQVKARAEADEKKKEADKAAAEQKRKDLALLATYSSEAEFDVVRDRTIEPIKGRIKSAQERMEAIDKRTKQIEEEMEFYKAGKKASAKKTEAPPMLVSELDRLKSERAGLVKGVAGYEREIVEIGARSDVDKKRWVALKTGGVNKPSEDPKGPTRVTLTAGAMGEAKCAGKVYECPAGTQYICKEGRKETKVACVVPGGK